MRTAIHLVGPILLGAASVAVREARYGLGAEILLGLGAAWLAAALLCFFLGVGPAPRAR